MRSRWPEWCALSAYSALVAFAIPFHEPFADEAQGWQLARSLPLASLFKLTFDTKDSRPLAFPALDSDSRQVSYTASTDLRAIAVAATALLLFSRLSSLSQATVAFYCLSVYQYAVVARNYILAPILLYAIALFWKRSPLILALLLGLLANVALHAAVSPAAWHRISRRAGPPSRRQTPAPSASTPARRSHSSCSVGVCHLDRLAAARLLRSLIGLPALISLLIFRGAVGSLVLGIFYLGYYPSPSGLLSSTAFARDAASSTFCLSCFLPSLRASRVLLGGMLLLIPLIICLF